MPKDPRVTTAVAHWGARFVANGIVLTDFEDVTGSINDSGVTGAGRGRIAPQCTRQLGREALNNGKLLTAGEHLQRAGVSPTSVSFYSCTTSSR